VIDTLRALDLAYEEFEIDPELADTAAFCAAYGVPLDRSANTILVASRRPVGKMVACLVLATCRLDVNGAVRRRLEVRKASFATAEETVERTGMAIGGVTPLGLPAEIPVWIDHRVIEPDWVVVGAGSRSAKIRLDPRGLSRLHQAEVVPDLAVPA
jgi:prolyl-tRNA editing enzyme YbaK/EbsC (Cys-tRNA(Pro) deacylase)